MSTRFVAPVRVRNLLWLAVVGGIWAATEIWGTPHLRVVYRWTGSVHAPFYLSCQYWGLSSFTLRPADGRCPLVLLGRGEGSR